MYGQLRNFLELNSAVCRANKSKIVTDESICIGIITTRKYYETKLFVRLSRYCSRLKII